MKLNFWKYEGAGNDFVLFDCRETNFEPAVELLSAVCDRRRGIGADGVMLLTRSTVAQFGMRYFNSDGRESTMCGNGGRCIALFADNLGIGSAVKRFSAVDGLHEAEILSRDAFTAVVRLKMVDVAGVETFDGDYFLNTGSPHLVRRVADLAMDVVGEGRALRCSARLASMGGANINFIRIEDEGKISIRTYERGVEDETLACGTGATAAAIAVNHAFQPAVKHFEVKARGGDLAVDFDTDDNSSYRNIFLTGPSRMVFAGEADIENFAQ